jgi:PTS system glucose-specific IIA component
MSLFQFLKKKESDTAKINNCVVAPADGEIVAAKDISDPVFSGELLGKTVGLKLAGDKAVLTSPADGVLTVLFPTGHAFGVTTNDGIEILVHIGIDTVEAKGEGFTLKDRKQGDKVAAGDPIVEVDLALLGKTYDMITPIAVTNDNGHQIEFTQPGPIKRGEILIKELTK